MRREYASRETLQSKLKKAGCYRLRQLFKTLSSNEPALKIVSPWQKNNAAGQCFWLKYFYI